MNLARRIWPHIPDRPSAEAISRHAAKWYIAAAVLSALLGLISLYSGQAIRRSEFSTEVAASAFSLVDAALFGLIAYKISNMSVGWSAAGLALGLVGVLFSLLSGELSPIALIIELYLLLKFVNAVRAARIWHRLGENPPADQYRVASIEPK